MRTEKRGKAPKAGRMSPEQFAYWLQGHIENRPPDQLPTPTEWASIREHLGLVFHKVTMPALDPSKSVLTREDDRKVRRALKAMQKEQEKQRARRPAVDPSPVCSHNMRFC